MPKRDASSVLTRRHSSNLGAGGLRSLDRPIRGSPVHLGSRVLQEEKDPPPRYELWLTW